VFVRSFSITGAVSLRTNVTFANAASILLFDSFVFRYARSISPWQKVARAGTIPLDARKRRV